MAKPATMRTIVMTIFLEMRWATAWFLLRGSDRVWAAMIADALRQVNRTGPWDRDRRAPRSRVPSWSCVTDHDLRIGRRRGGPNGFLGSGLTLPAGALH